MLYKSERWTLPEYYKDSFNIFCPKSVFPDGNVFFD